MTNEPDADGQKRTLVLDNLIHGYFILGHPERLDYDYEHIYALVDAHRVAGGEGEGEGRASRTPRRPPLADALPRRRRVHASSATCSTSTRDRRRRRRDRPGRDPRPTTSRWACPGTRRSRRIFGDARQFVERNQKARKQYDIVFGDAFNDFSVPWHLTTREFNDKLARMIGPEGVYMINIIDAYESDEKAAREGRGPDREGEDHVRGRQAGRHPRRAEAAKAERFGGFLGAWVRTARLTFPHIYIFGTDDNPGSGLRETFVVVASKTDLKLDDPKDRSAAATTTPSSSRTTAVRARPVRRRTTARRSTSARGGSS